MYIIFYQKIFLGIASIIRYKIRYLKYDQILICRTIQFRKSGKALQLLLCDREKGIRS